MINCKSRLFPILAMLFAYFFISAQSPGVNEEKDRPLAVGEILKIIADFEKIMNKTCPTMPDFNYLYKGDGEGEREMVIAERYCEEVAKLEYDTKPCSDALHKLYGNTKASLNLLNIKNILTDSKNVPIKIYVTPKINLCTIDQLHSKEIDIDTIAVIGTTKYKRLVFTIPCSANEAYNYSLIDVFKIDGKIVSDYPLTITKPLTESK